MVGLRTQENIKFMRFWEMIQNKASEMNCTFFLDCGEGNDYSDDTIECENLTGWLIPNEKRDEFEAVFLSNDSIDDKWAEFLSLVKWEHNNNSIRILFT